MELNGFNLGKLFSFIFFILAFCFYGVGIIRIENIFDYSLAFTAFTFGNIFALTSIFTLIITYGEKILSKL